MMAFYVAHGEETAMALYVIIPWNPDDQAGVSFIYWLCACGVPVLSSELENHAQTHGD